MSDLATKMSLSATSDKAKHQGPSSCHVLAGAWGKTPSGAGKYFPNRHPRKHRFHQMVKSAVATACMLLAFVCQIATASFAQTDAAKQACSKNNAALVKKRIREYIIKEEGVQGIDEITEQVLENIFDGDGDFKWLSIQWRNGDFLSNIKTTLSDEFSDLFNERKEVANARREANRIAKAEANRIAKAEAMAEQVADEVLQHTANEMLDDQVESAAGDHLELLKEKRRKELADKLELLKEKRRKELADKFREFDVVKTKMNTDDQGLTNVRGRKFHFGLSKDVLGGEMLEVFPKSPETPIVYYEGSSKKCFIAVTRFESYLSHTVSFPKSEKKYQGQGYKTSICYKARGTCYEYKDNRWKKNNSRKKKDEKDDESFVAFWVKNSSEIDIGILNEYLAMLPPKLALARRDANELL